VDRVGAFRDVMRLPDVRRIELGWGWSLAGGSVATVAFLVYAYQAGGAALVAAYGIARTLPGAVVTPLVSSAADRVRRDRLLLLTTGIPAIVFGLAAAWAPLGGPPVVIVALAGTSAAIAGTYRPLQAATLPWLVRTPAELAAGNIAATMMENAGSLLGPVLAAVALVVAGPAAAMAVAAGCLGLATLAVWRLAVPEESHAGTQGVPRSMREATAGAAALLRIAPPAGLAVLTFAQTFVRGAMLVVVVVVALDVLALGEDSVGWLNAAMGLGGLAGGLAAGATLRLTRLGRSFVLGIALWGLPLVLLAAVPTPLVAYLALVVVGIGNAIEDASMFTLLPRLVGPRLAGRTLGALELVIYAGLGAGSVAAPVLVAEFGTRAVLAVMGATVAVLAVAYALRFAQIDRTTAPPGREIDLLRGLPMFASLPLVVVEQLAMSVEQHEYAAGEVVMREGERGDRFHIVVEGTGGVTVRGAPRSPLQPGDGFGEIALLRDVPRTATVRATERLHTLSLSRPEFLAAVTGNRVSAGFAHSLAEDRLAADAPSPGHSRSWPPRSP
jgi:hypothetical protein